ncbi:hypothetical protein [Thomasclavelia sp.]
MEMIICDPDIKECNLIERSVYYYYRNKNILIHIRCCSNWQELDRQIKEKITDIIIVAHNGVTGLDIITGLKIPSSRLIWFSDLDFGIQSYRLCVSYFNRKPISHEKVVHALEYIETI